MENKTMYGILALFVIAVLGLSGLAAAYGGFGFGKTLTEEDRAAMQERHEAMQEAIENNDFATWKSLHEQRIEKMRAELTEENFNVIVERHNQMEEFRTAMEEARESGDFSKMQELREQYGVEGGQGFGRGKGMHSMGKFAK